MSVADLFLLIVGLALSVFGALGILRPGTGRAADRLTRILQRVCGGVILLIAAAFLRSGWEGLPHG